jgi:hypothetical protein
MFGGVLGATVLWKLLDFRVIVPQRGMHGDPELSRFARAHHPRAHARASRAPAQAQSLGRGVWDTFSGIPSYRRQCIAGKATFSTRHPIDSQEAQDSSKAGVVWQTRSDAFGPVR